MTPEQEGARPHKKPRREGAYLIKDASSRPAKVPAPEQEAGEGVARGDKDRLLGWVAEIETTSSLLPDDLRIIRSLIHDACEPAPTPSPRCGREWTLEVCPKCGATEEMEPEGCDYCEVSGGHLEKVTVREVRETAPAPSPHEGEAARCDGDCIGWGCPVHDPPAPTEPRESCDCLHCNTGEPVPESHSRLFNVDAWLREEARAEQAEAERDTAQASEARLRAALEEIAEETGTPYARIARAALQEETPHE